MKAHRYVAVTTLALAAWSANGQSASGTQPALTFIWHEGDRAEMLKKLAEQYTRQTGIEIRAMLVPLGNEWYQRIADEFARKGSAFDLCIFDSQSMSEFASQGHLVRLNDLMSASPRVRAADFDAAALRRYAEYPEDSGNIYALPINQDCMGLIYRADLFEDPNQKAAFRETYGYELAPPETYDQLRDIAEYYTRPIAAFYGVALYGSADYDGCTSAFNNILWSFGGELWDPKSGRAEDFINSPAAKKALEFYKGLFAFAPPGARDWYVTEVSNAVKNGRVAMAIHWYYYFRDVHAATVGSPIRLAIAPLPGQKGADGRFHRAVMIGGQGIAISQYSAHKDEAWKFLEWLMSKDAQWKWVESGGKTGLSAILTDPKFLDAAPANRSFGGSMGLTKDYWHLPEYPQLLQVYQNHVHQAIAGQSSSADALDACAREHERILRSSGGQAGAASAGRGDAKAARAKTGSPGAAERVTVIARIKARPGKEAVVRAELQKLLAPTRVERGCINYDMHEAPGDPSMFLFYENWESEADLTAHLQSPHIQAWFKLSEDLLAEPVEITRLRRVE
jgi:multiple sugar transport system substrate-binding protein